MSAVEICSLANAVLETGFCAFTLPVALSNPRGILSVGTSDFLALERGSSSVVYVFDADDDGIPESRQTIADASSLNHGLAIYDGYIYASSDRNVFRWSYQNFTNSTSLGPEELVVTNINPDGMGGAPQGHRTRTLEFDDVGRLYVSIGSVGNVDPDSFRSRIRRFPIREGGFPLDFQQGEVFADGLRNEVGLAFDVHGVLWGVENGADRLVRSDLDGDIHEDNPAEELNRFREEDAGKHWGYPYCWTEFNLPENVGGGRDTVWAWPSFLDDGVVTDEQCRSDYVPPVLSMQGHSAPLGIVFYKWKSPDELPEECTNDPFPEKMNGYAFIAFHGSWNRDVPTGYKVVYVPFDERGDPTDCAIDLLAHEPPDAKWEDGFRPVDVDFDDCGRLLVSGDGSGSKMVRIEYVASNDPDGESDPKDATDEPCPCQPTQNPVEIPSGAIRANSMVLLALVSYLLASWFLLIL
jgi:glucose/arabinose dehydrogenase